MGSETRPLDSRLAERWRVAPVFHGGTFAGMVDPFAAGLDDVGRRRIVYAMGNREARRPEEYVLEDLGPREGLVWRLLRVLDYELGSVPLPPPPGPPPPLTPPKTPPPMADSPRGGGPRGEDRGSREPLLPPAGPPPGWKGTNR